MRWCISCTWRHAGVCLCKEYEDEEEEDDDDEVLVVLVLVEEEEEDTARENTNGRMSSDATRTASDIAGRFLTTLSFHEAPIEAHSSAAIGMQSSICTYAGKTYTGAIG